MKLDYITKLNPAPIHLPIGTLRKPTLIEISEFGFDKFEVLQTFIKMSPELFYTKLNDDEGKAFWNRLTDSQKESITLYDLIQNDNYLRDVYLSIFNFFFAETVVFNDGMFMIFNREVNVNSELTIEDVHGVINEGNFLLVLDLIQQICCIHENEESTENMQFKNKAAKKLYEKMHKAQNSNKKKADINMSLPNIISAVSNKHPSINPVNVWKLTIFQLMDSFERLQSNVVFDINCVRMSVWGDEKKSFDISSWYKASRDI